MSCAPDSIAVRERRWRSRRCRCPRTRRRSSRSATRRAMPADSNASHDTSSSKRCWGSIVTASRGEMPKNWGSNSSTLVDVPARPRHDLARDVRIGVVVLVHVPPVGRDLADGVDTVGEELPQGRRVVGPAGHPAAHPDDRDRFVGRRARRRPGAAAGPRWRAARASAARARGSGRPSPGDPRLPPRAPSTTCPQMNENCVDAHGSPPITLQVV